MHCKQLMIGSSLLQILLCLVAQLSGLANAFEDVSTLGRSETMLLIDGDKTEKRLRMERCSMSSNRESCFLAIDHDVNQEAWSNECAITGADMRPWWTARLENPAFITRILIHGLDRIGERGLDALTDFQLLAGTRICLDYQSYSTFFNKTVSCDTFSDFVTIQSNHDHAVLALCEVAVYGKSVRFSFADNGLTKLNTQTKAKCLAASQTMLNPCHLAIDGNLEQDASKPGVCYLSELSSAVYEWMEIWLNEPALIREVQIHNRVDQRQKELRSFEIKVDEQVCARHNVDDTTGFSVKTVSCKRFGTKVKFMSTVKNNQLGICEITLYGSPIEYTSQTNSKYIGCYGEKRSRRDMQKLVSVQRVNIPKCERMCRRRRKPFFALQQGRQCWCSERYGRYGKVEEDRCWMNCRSTVDYCGAKLTNSVYQIVALTEGSQDFPDASGILEAEKTA